MKKHKKLFAVMLALAMVFTLFAVPVMAQEGTNFQIVKSTWQHEEDPDHPDDVYLIGQEVHYQTKVVNTSDTYDLTIKISDEDPSGEMWWYNATTDSWQLTDPDTPVTIQPGGDWESDFHYTVEEGALIWNEFYGIYSIVNKLIIEGNQGPETIDASGTKTSQVVQPDISVTKEADREVSKVGSTVTYTIGIENTGDIALENITVNDSLLGDLSGDFPDTLAVGESFSDDFEYTILEGDIVDGEVLNEVEVAGTAEGFDPDVVADIGPVVTDSADAEVAIVSPAIEITKEADKETSKVGSTVTYTIGIENTGDIALENITVDDSLLGDLSGDFPDTLAVGESFSDDFPYVVDADDVEDGKVVNEVRVDANPEGMDNEIWDEASFEVSIVSPAIELTKSVNPDTAQVGDTVTYTICIENIGDWDLENIVVNDTLLGGPLAGFPDTLAVGADPVCVDFDYVIQEGDVVDGEVVNTADVYANPVGMDNDITDDDYAVVTIEELEVVCETAWAYGGEEADEVVENNSLPGTGNAWGWTNRVEHAETVNDTVYANHYEFDLYTGAAQNDITKGTWVGTVTVHIEGADSWVRYEIGDGMDCWFSELHLWVGDTELPETRRGYTAAPGQFNYSAYPDDTEYTFYFDVSELEEIWVAAHAVVCCYEVME